AMRRLGMLLASTCAMSLLLAAPTLAANSHKGKVVEAGAGKLTMTDLAGQNQQTHAVAVDAIITFGGQDGGVGGLQVGANITLTRAKNIGQTVVTKIHEHKATTASK